jgi:branched-subunit amino acid transport protein AzlD
MNGIFKYGSLIFNQSWITVIGAVLLIAFTFIYAFANEALLSKQFIHYASKYIGACYLAMLLILALAAVYISATAQQMPGFIMLLMTISMAMIVAAIYYAMVYLSIRLGNWLASFVVKTNAVL